jgi:hypothetical protein
MMIVEVRERPGDQDVTEEWLVAAHDIDDATAQVRKHLRTRGPSVELRVSKIADAPIDGSPRVIRRIGDGNDGRAK